MTGPAWQQFRGRIINRLWALDPNRFVYISRDKILGACPSCKAGLPEYVAVTFVGELPKAVVYCSAGCTDQLLAQAFDLPVAA